VLGSWGKQKKSDLDGGKGGGDGQSYSVHAAAFLLRDRKILTKKNADQGKEAKGVLGVEDMGLA